MTIATLRKRTLTTVAIIGCLVLVAALMLGIWFLFSTRSSGGGGVSVGETFVQYLRVRPDGEVSLVIWSDLSGGAGQSSHSDLFESSAAGFFSSADGRRIDWEWKSPKEKGGAFQINGTPHDLAIGTLFLVSTKGGQVRVRQLDVDLSKVRPDKKGFEALAENQPQVAKFIAEASWRK
jgi:hypothetical protein